MVLALNRTGVVFKKCDRAGHKPDSNKAMRGRDVPAHVL